MFAIIAYETERPNASIEYGRISGYIVGLQQAKMSQKSRRVDEIMAQRWRKVLYRTTQTKITLHGKRAKSTGSVRKESIAEL